MAWNREHRLDLQNGGGSLKNKDPGKDLAVAVTKEQNMSAQCNAMARGADVILTNIETGSKNQEGSECISVHGPGEWSWNPVTSSGFTF